ncbi:unnamed protein product [Alopecurus aequalis]
MGDESLLERRLNRDDEPMDLPLELLQRITNYFSEERKIGQGGFGDVYKGEAGNMIVAVKRINVSTYTIDDQSFQREIGSLMKINHPNVVRFLGFCSNTCQKLVKKDGTGEMILANVKERLLCFEYISNGSLDNYINDELRGLEWEKRYEIITGLCMGLYYLHVDKNIIHMDLKPPNILLDGKSMVPKITDFGLSRPNRNSHTKGRRFGTRGYLAPEYEDDGKTSFNCDIYSLGVIIIELVTGCKGIPKVLRRWRHRWSTPPTLLQIEQVTKCIEIAVRCRKIKPEDRPSIKEITYLLSKPGSTDGLTTQIIPSFAEDDMLKIEPLEIRLASGLKKISCTLELSNSTRKFIAFNIQLPSTRYNAQPIKGIVQPKSMYIVTITVQSRDEFEHRHAEKFIVQSMEESDGLRDEDIRTRSFEEADKFVDEVNVMVVYDSAFRKSKLGSPRSERAHLLRHYPINKIYLGIESDVAVNVARGAMGSLLEKLGKLVTEDYNLGQGIKRDIESFSQGMKNMLQDFPRIEKFDGVKFWVNEVRNLSYKVEDMVDTFLVHVEPELDLGAFKEFSKESRMLFDNGNGHICDLITNIKRRVDVVADSGKNALDNAATKASIDLRISAVHEDKEPLIGIKHPRDKLISLFEKGTTVSRQRLKIFSIHGLGGMGKTALAKSVYDKLQEQYHPRAFVTVGQNVDVKMTLKNILIQCGKNAQNLEHSDVQQFISELHDLLKYKRYLIVIDDIWDLQVWDAIKSAFPVNKGGGRVITTTRNSNTASSICYAERNYMHMMKPLSDEDSRRLFFSRVFGSQKACPDAVKDISVDILKRCGGMPLAITSIARVLAGDQPRSIWDNVRENWVSMIDANDLENMKNILDVSFDQLMTCLLHIGMYPEDRDIDKKDMLRQWVAEGFIYVLTDRAQDAEEIAELYFNILVAMHLIHGGDMVDKEESKVLPCRVHPIILDLIRLKSSEENLYHVIGGLNEERTDGSKDEIHRVSVHFNGKEDKKLLETIKEESLSHVRSVLLYRSSLVSNFLEFKYVRVLHLEHKVPSNGLDLTGISRLFLLRYLKVTSDHLSRYELKLPDKIGKLQQLETIDLHNASLKNYPSDIVSLPWLTHLCSTGRKACVVLPEGIKRLTSLRTLVGVDVFGCSAENIKGISKLANLRELDISLDGIGQNIVAMHGSIDILDVLPSSISMVSSSLRILTFGDVRIPIFALPSWSMTLFPGGSPIQDLDLGGLEFVRCPEWIGQLQDLRKLHIMVREVADGVRIAAGLPSLGWLHLKIEVAEDEQKEEHIVIPGGLSFQALNVLSFHCPKVSLTFERGAMPKLQILQIKFRYQMAPRFLPVGIENLPATSLREIHVRMESNKYKGIVSHVPSVVTEHKIYVKQLLKAAFAPYHPAVEIFLVLDGVLSCLIQEHRKGWSITIGQADGTGWSVTKNQEDDEDLCDEEVYYSADEGIDDGED